MVSPNRLSPAQWAVVSALRQGHTVWRSGASRGWILPSGKVVFAKTFKRLLSFDLIEEDWDRGIYRTDSPSDIYYKLTKAGKGL
jgi:hypothetical protein